MQLREKHSDKSKTVALGKRLLDITRKYGVPLIINDSPWLAKEIGADGVHLGEEDCSVEEARSIIGAESIIGVSCYNRLERGIHAEKSGADYVAFGSPYYTTTKPDREPTSLDILREAVRRIKTIPIFAIGGITTANAAPILETGVDGIAVITSVFGSDDVKQAAAELSLLIQKH